MRVLRNKLPRLLAVLVAAFGLLAASSTASHAAPQQPAVAISASEVADGEEIAVELSGWTPGVLVSVAVCGTGSGSTGCADHFAAQAVPGQEGSAGVQLVVVAPPAPCPCVVRALSVDGGAVSTPIAIGGTAPVPSVQSEEVVPQPRLEASVRVAGGPTLREQFALGGQRAVIVRVTNVSTAPSEPGALDILLGRNSRSGDVAASFALPVLAPGEVFEVAQEISIPTGTTGKYVVYAVAPGSIDAIGQATFESWAMLGLAAVAMIGAFVWALVGSGRRGVRFVERVSLGVVVAVTGAGLAALYVSLQ